MLKVTKNDIASELDSYLNQALTQPVVIEKAGQEAVVVLSMVEYERLQEVEDRQWAESARRANTEGYLEPRYQVMQRLAAAMKDRRSKTTPSETN